MLSKHMRGLAQDHNRQARETKKMGGPSKALRRLKKRPELNKDGRCFMGDIDPDLQPKKKWNWKK